MLNDESKGKIMFTIRLQSLLRILLMPVFLLAGLWPFIGQAGIGDIIRSFPSPGPNPRGLAFTGSCLWNADATSSYKIYCLNPANGSIIKQCPSPDYPAGITWDGQYLWIVGYNNHRIYKVDPDSCQVIHWILTPASSPQGLAWDGSYLWHVDTGTDTLYRLDPQTGNVIYSRSIGSISGTPIDLDFVQGEIYMVDGAAKRIVKFNPYSGQLTTPPIIGLPGTSPYGLAWDGQNLFLSDFGTDRIYLLSLAPTLAAQVSVNKTDLGVGDTVTGKVKRINDSTPDVVRYMVWLQNPDGTLQSLKNQIITVPANANTTQTVLTHIFPGDWPAGSYLLGARLLEPTTGATLAYSTVQFRFTYAQDTASFPMTGDSYTVQSYPYWWHSNDQAQGVRTLALSSVNALKMNLIIGENYLIPAAKVDMAVYVNDQQVGTFTIVQGNTSISKDFSFAPIAGPTYTLKLVETNDVLPNGGNVVIPPDVSTFQFEGTPGTGTLSTTTAPRQESAFSPLPSVHSPTPQNMNLP